MQTNKKLIERSLISLTILFSCLFYFFYLISEKASDISLALLILASVAYTLKYNKNLLNNKLIILSFITVLYLYSSTLIRIEVFNQPARLKYTQVLALFFIFIFIGQAFSLLKNHKNLLIYSLLAGTLFFLLINFNFNEWINAFNGRRVDFSIKNAQHSGVIFLLLAITSLFLLKATNKYLAYTFAVLFFILMLFTQVRALILGLSVSSFIYLLISIYLKNKKIIINISLTLLLIILLLFAFQKENISNRMSTQSYDLQALSLYLEQNKIKPTSTVVRVVSWEIGYQWFLEKPIFGHGAGALKHLIDNNTVFKKTFKGKFGHLHNTYLEILIAYGVIGLALYLLIIGTLVFKFLSRVYLINNNLLQNNHFLFFIFYFPPWIIANFFESYFFYPSGIIINSFLFGYLYYIAYIYKSDI